MTRCFILKIHFKILVQNTAQPYIGVFHKNKFYKLMTTISVILFVTLPSFGI